MGVELRPLGVKCNIQCQYCYQNPQRDAGNVPNRYDVGKMKAAVEREGGGFTLFGGEALLVPKPDLEELWRWGLEKYGRNGIQTNGSLIDDDHVRMFKQYKVHVGISLDGPGELNDVRWNGTLQKTREATERTEAAIERLGREGIPPSLIVTLHRGNATPDKLPIMHAWLRRMAALGVTSARLHILEADNDYVRQKYVLSTEENVNALLSFLDLQAELPILQLDLFNDMRNMLLGRDRHTTCIWNACDPYTTRAVRGVEGDGQSSNCGRTNKDGIDFTKASTEGFERYIALYYTPWEHGGCKDCRFFLMCKGQCPGTSIGGEWRNRTEHCELWLKLFEKLEEQLVQEGHEPISRHWRRPQVEQAFLQSWALGRNTTIQATLEQLRGPQSKGPAAEASMQSKVADNPTTVAVTH